MKCGHLIGLTVALPILCSCGGGQRATTGRAIVSVRWPERSRLIPLAASSVRVVLRQGGQEIGAATLERPLGGGTVQARFDALPTGEIQVAASAHPQAGGLGVAQASATTTGTIVAEQTTALGLTMASTIVRGNVSPASVTVTVGRSTTLGASFQDASGQAVFVSDATQRWSSRSPTVASVDSTGRVVGVAPGAAIIEARDTESGIVATASVTVRSSGEIVFNPANGHYYQVVSVPSGIIWPDAKAAAEVRGGYLATITSAEENSFVFNLTNAPEFWGPGGSPSSSFGPWLGGFRASGAARPIDGWQWVTGETWGYTNWHVGQPDRASGTEDKLHFWVGTANQRGSNWNDIVPDNRPVAYVIEWDSNPGS